MRANELHEAYIGMMTIAEAYNTDYMGYYRHRSCPSELNLGGTPLNDALLTMHTIIPGMVYNSDNRPLLSYGVMGGDYQPIGHAHVLSNIIDHGLNVQEALDAPRFMPYDTYVDIETGINPSSIDKLGLWGHDIRFSTHPLGGGQAISINWSEGTLSGGSDPRKDGLAIGY